MTAAGFDCVLGMDVGGTSTRALVIDRDGEQLGVGNAAGGNPVANGKAAAASNLLSAVNDCLTDVDPGRVDAVVMGIAGAMTVQSGEPQPMYTDTLHEVGLDCPIFLIPDAVVAFAAGAAEAAGTVLIAGTGAIACGVAQRQLSGRRADGYGWLLGDLGSGTWLGKQAIYATLQYTAGHGPGGPLVTSVLAELGLSDTDASLNAIIGKVMPKRPVELSRFAPLVTRAADAEDPVASDIVDNAVAHLVDSVTAVRDDSDTSPVVFAGSLATTRTRLAGRLREKVQARYPSAPIRIAVNGAAGAAWLAAREVCNDETALVWLHSHLTAST